MSSSNSLLYISDGKILKLDLGDFVHGELKMKKSKVSCKDVVLSLVKLSESKLLAFSSDNCVKYVNCERGIESPDDIVAGFLCPYCLHPFSSLRDLNDRHMGDHLGPVSCSTCQVESAFYIF